MMYREDFARIQCDVPGCECSSKRGDPLTLAAACHPAAGCRVVYLPSTNAVEVSCKVCRAPVAQIAVAAASAAEGN